MSNIFWGTLGIFVVIFLRAYGGNYCIQIFLYFNIFGPQVFFFLISFEGTFWGVHMADCFFPNIYIFFWGGGISDFFF